MGKLALIFLAFVFGAISVSALADELPKSRSMADICPARNAPLLEAAGLDDLVIRTPPKPSPASDAARAEVADQQRQCIESQRKLAAVPKQTWDKMSDAGKVEAVEKAKAARLKGDPAEK